MPDNARTAQELADDIQAAIAELADGRVFPDLVDAVNTLAAMKAVAFTEQHVRYVTRYGGKCRDCADADGVCPSSGMPCRDAEKAVRHVFKAITYGVQHGYIPSPIAALASQAEPVAEVVVTQEVVGFGRRESRKSVKFLRDVPAGVKLYTAPPAPAQAEQSEDGRRIDAWASNPMWRLNRWSGKWSISTPDSVLTDWLGSPRAAIDAAIAAKEQQS